MNIIIDNKKIPVPSNIFPCKRKDMKKSLFELYRMIVMAKAGNITIGSFK